MQKMQKKYIAEKHIIKKQLINYEIITYKKNVSIFYNNKIDNYLTDINTGILDNGYILMFLVMK